MSYQTFDELNRAMQRDFDRTYDYGGYPQVREDDEEAHPALVVIIALAVLLGFVAVGATIVAMLSMLTVLIVVGGLGVLLVGAMVLMFDDRE